MEFVHFSKSVKAKSYLGEITPTLLILPNSSITIFFDLWSSIISNYPMYPCFCMILRNFKRTLEAGLMRTCFFPFLSALTIVLKQSARMLALVISMSLWQKQFNIFYTFNPNIFLHSQLNPINFTIKLLNIYSTKSQTQVYIQFKNPTKMLVPKPEHSGIHVRNFLTIFVFLSLLAYVHFQLGQATSSLDDTNSIVRSILSNQTYTISRQRLLNLQRTLNAKSYHQYSQAQCLTKIYLDVLNNQKFRSQNLQQNSPQPNQREKVELTFTDFIFPTTNHDLQGFKNCSDILTLINFLNPTKTDFIYTKFMQQKYGSLIESSEKDQGGKEQIELTNFCIISNQFNTSTTKLRQNINSVIDQSYQNYRFVVLDNGSTDGSYQIAKVILQDLKEKLIEESKEQEKLIQSKYKVIKQESKLGLWQLYKKHEGLCQGMEYVIFLDGRDSLATRLALNILNSKIVEEKQKPQLITAALLQKKQLNRLNPAQFLNSSKLKQIPAFTFKVISTQLLNSTIGKLDETTQKDSHGYEVQARTVESLFEYCSQNNKTVKQIDEMLYVYDTIDNKDSERNEYFMSIVKRQLAKDKKQQKKQASKAE